jgi:hypothetical protein
MFVVPFALNDEGEDVEASRRTDPLEGELLMLQLALTLVGGSAGYSVLGDRGEHDVTAPVTVVASVKVEGVDVY